MSDEQVDLAVFEEVAEHRAPGNGWWFPRVAVEALRPELEELLALRAENERLRLGGEITISPNVEGVVISGARVYGSTPPEQEGT